MEPTAKLGVEDYRKRFDKEFAEKHQDFVKWWAHHPECDLELKRAISPRVAYKCDRYRQEFLEAKAVGSA